MNYSEFYKKSKQRLTEALVSMWASGHTKEQECLRELLEEKEPLIAEPVFQTIFPWQPAPETFDEHASKLGILDKDFVSALSNINGDKADFCFPANRHPYSHQSESWKAMLCNHKTIAVTSGTGSGKTECFIIPVLQDLYRERCKANYTEGVQAIFLYPLNALMKNQRERIDAWCNSLPQKVEYAIYNGELDDRDREKMRKRPPQILFTNPTMLNYMMVRAKDQSLLEKSKGRLRWILLDEAHTYSGSSATELALQIRRVIDAFGVTLDEVRFAVTSATMGGKDAEEKLKGIVSQLTGKRLSDIQIINGTRIIPSLDKKIQQEQINTLNKKYGTNLSIASINNLRKKLNDSPALFAKDIAKEAGLKSNKIDQQLSLIDDLSTEIKDLGGKDKNLALLPTRAHFFMRSINGIYACVNPNCKSKTSKSLDLGNFTTYQNTKCPDCGGNMVEVASCADCGEFLVVGENNTKNEYRLRTNEFSLDYNPFEIDSQELDEDSEDSDESFKSREKGWEMFIYGMPERTNPRNIAPFYFEFNTKEGKIQPITESKKSSLKQVFQTVLDADSGKALCPCCGVTLGKKLAYFRTGSTLLGRVLASTILDNATPMSLKERAKDCDILYEGRKYITFTDSRQGTAKFSMSLNQDVERNWVRSFLYHHLADIRRNKLIPKGLTPEQQQEYDGLNSMGNGIPPFLQPRFEELKALATGNNTPTAELISWPDIKSSMEANANLSRLFKYLKNARWNTTSDSPINDTEKSGFLDAMFLDQFGWIPRNSNTLENLGLIHIVYPTLATMTVPEDLGKLGFTDDEWRNYLKICIDYQIRGGKHYVVPSSAEIYLMQQAFTKDIYDPDSSFEKGVKWPSIDIEDKISIRQPKLILLLMAALGIKNLSELKEKKNLINTILKKAWTCIKDNVLQETDHENQGYRLNLLDKNRVAIQILEFGWKCPVDNVVVDTLFKGFSPRVRGYATEDNLKRFKVEQESMQFPYFPFANGKKIQEDKSKVDVNRDEIVEWINVNWKVQKQNGILNNLHYQILNPAPIFIAGEHSAQQQSQVLEGYEKAFNQGHLNILSCSTTMEMGVDLKGISAVVMNSVPPKPANYQQRAGRAGRRGETKALTLTFCAPNPVGIHAWKNPSWPLHHKTELPDVKLTSPQIVQRHINAFLFEKFVQENGGMGIRETIEEFFISQESQHSYYEKFRKYLHEMPSNIDEYNETNRHHENLVAKSCLSNQSLFESLDNCFNQIGAVYSIFSDRKNALESSWLQAQECGKAVQKAVESRKQNFLKSNLLTYLAEQNFLPSAGIPTGLVDFNTMNKSQSSDSKHKNVKKPTQHLSQAISMYTPGKQVVINNWCYESKGISMKSKFEETKRNIIQSCSKCGFTQIIYGEPINQCPMCHATSMFGLKKDDNSAEQSKFTEIIEPAGFSVDWSGSCWPTQVIKTDNTMSMVQPLLLQMEPWTKTKENAKVAIRTSTKMSEILFYNNGTHKAGFMLCPFCGRMESEVDEASFQRFSKHKHLETGGECEGATDEGKKIRRNVLLVGRYQTDFVEMKFFDQNNCEIRDLETLYSLGVIISRKLSEFLGCNDGEIDFGYNNKFNSIFIFDTALGGAGYSPLLRDYKNEVFNLARTALSNDNCEKACTNCLIDRKSQWYLNYLNRPKALQWLEMEYLTRNAPTEVKEVFPDAETITTDWGSEFCRICRDENVKSLKLFIEGDATQWEPDKFLFSHQLEILKAKSVNCSFIIPDSIDISKMDVLKLTNLLPILYRNNFECGNININNLKPVLGIEYKNGQKRICFGTNVTTSFSDKWGIGLIYSAIYNQNFNFNTLQIDKIQNAFNYQNEGMFEFVIKKDRTTVKSIFETIRSCKPEKWEAIDNVFAEKDEIEISYADKFVNTPLGCIILANLINSIINKWNIRTSSVKLYLSSIKSDKIYGKNDFECDFTTAEIRNRFIKNCFKQIVGVELKLDTENSRHPRSLQIKGKQYSCVIRPDAGVAWGWALDNREHLRLCDFENDMNRDITLYNKQQKEGILYTIGWQKK